MGVIDRLSCAMVPLLCLVLAGVAFATPIPKETVLIPWKAPTGDGVVRPQDHLIPLLKGCLLKSEHCQCEQCVCIDCKCGMTELKKKAPYVFGYDDPIYGDLVHYDDLLDTFSVSSDDDSAVPFYSADDFETGKRPGRDDGRAYCGFNPKYQS